MAYPIYGDSLAAMRQDAREPARERTASTTGFAHLHAVGPRLADREGSIGIDAVL